jgi:hypothetical protein
MSFLFLQHSAAQHHALVHQDIVAYLRSLADNNTGAVVNEETPAYDSAGVDFDLREKTVDLRDQTAYKEPPVAIEEMGHTVPPQRMQARVKDEHFERAPRRRVTVHSGPDIFPHSLDYIDHLYSVI